MVLTAIFFLGGGGLSLPTTCLLLSLISVFISFQESESAAEESSPGSERGSFDRGPAPQAVTEGKTWWHYFSISIKTHGLEECE